MTVMGKVHKSSNKKFSKRQKEKFNFPKKGKKEFKPTGKRGRLIVRNLPFKCNENELHKHFSHFGEIKDIHLLRRPDNKLVGCGFIEFSSRLNADRAIEQLNGKPFLGRPIYVDRAVARERYDESSREEEKEKSSEEMSDKESVKNELDESEIKEEPMSDNEESLLDSSQIKREELDSDEQGEREAMSRGGEFQNAKNMEESSKNTRKARLIVRNLSFKTTEEQFKAHFSHFGDVEEVKLLRKPDNTLIGCGFVQFTKKSGAAKAIHHTSGKPFLGRPIIVDWAIAKDKFKQMQEEALKKEIKKEDVDDEETKTSDGSNVKIKEEESNDETKEQSSNESESSDSEEEESSDEDKSTEDEEDVKSEIKHEEESRRQRNEDVDEGKTVFVKNLPFSVDNAEFQECMEQFGPVYYALVCKDKLTEHSKGSGFVKFKNKEDAEKCLSSGTELTLKGTILDPHIALRRNEVQKLNEKSKEKKDNRNLYLIKEGMIMAGTPAAKGLSVTDMEQRLHLEQWKTTKLRNLNMFVSRNRLVVHNLPLTMGDKQLCKLFKKHAGPKAFIKESRVMRDLKHVDTSGKGVSKGYGFVSFDKHEDALRALRSINNNPNIFTPSKRPIVAFSIENKSVLNTKTKRMVRSQQKNPLCKDYKPDEVEVPLKKSKHGNDVKYEEENEPQYAGIVAKPGTVKMRQRYKLKDQAQQHVQDVRKQKRDLKMSRKMRRAEHIKKKKVEKKSTKKKKNTTNSDAAFTDLVDKYKSKLLAHSSEKKKWYDS